LTRWDGLGDLTKIAHWREAGRVLREHWREAPSTDLQEVREAHSRLKDVERGVTGGRMTPPPELRTYLVRHTILAVRELVWARTEPTASHADRAEALRLAERISEAVRML